MKNVQKLKIRFWYYLCYFGSFLEYIGDKLETKGLDKLDEFDRSDPEALEYKRKKGWAL